MELLVGLVVVVVVLAVVFWVGPLLGVPQPVLIVLALVLLLLAVFAVADGGRVSFD